MAAVSQRGGNAGARASKTLINREEDVGAINRRDGYPAAIHGDGSVQRRVQRLPGVRGDAVDGEEGNGLARKGSAGVAHTAVGAKGDIRRPVWADRLPAGAM